MFMYFWGVALKGGSGLFWCKSPQFIKVCNIIYVGFKSDLNYNGFMTIVKEHPETSLQFAGNELGQEGVKDLEECLFVLRLP